ncbi:MAG: sulfite exporter TauE/SafE family protein [Thermodesulfovibrionales bacterium]
MPFDAALSGIYALAFMTGLTGGVGHCVGMCGPIVASYSVAAGSRGFLPHLLYGAGRVTTYALMGAALGLAGSLAGGADFVPRADCPSCGPGYLHWSQRLVMAAAGALVVAMGLGMAGWLPLVGRVERAALSLPLARKAMELFRGGGAGVGVYYPMGVAMGFIPCGLVYSVLATAGRAGMEAPNAAAGLLEGGLVMLLFGAGTVLPLAAFGRAASFVGARARRRLYRLSALFVVAMGAIFLIRALP